MRQANWGGCSGCKSRGKERPTTTFTASRASDTVRCQAKRQQRHVRAEPSGGQRFGPKDFGGSRILARFEIATPTLRHYPFDLNMNRRGGRAIAFEIYAFSHENIQRTYP